MNELIGSFYIQKTRSGNLIGEFTNNRNTRVFTESADLIVAVEDLTDFSGNYVSTWQEENVAIISNLRITVIESLNNRKLQLIWTDTTERKNILFQGEGFLAGELLIGHYTVVRNNSSQA